MTRFADDLYDDLMRDHGRALADIRPPVARRPLASHRVALTAGVGGLAAAATAGSLVALSGSPAYALTTNQNGTQTLAVYQPAGIAQANARFHQLKEPVVVVPVRACCPSLSSLPRPAVPGQATRISVKTRPVGQRLDHGGRARHPGRGHPGARRPDHGAWLPDRRRPDLGPGPQLREPAPAARPGRLRPPDVGLNREVTPGKPSVRSPHAGPKITDRAC